MTQRDGVKPLRGHSCLQANGERELSLRVLARVCTYGDAADVLSVFSREISDRDVRIDLWFVRRAQGALPLSTGLITDRNAPRIHPIPSGLIPDGNVSSVLVTTKMAIVEAPEAPAPRLKTDRDRQIRRTIIDCTTRGFALSLAGVAANVNPTSVGSC